MSQSVPYQLSQAIVGALRGALESDGVAVHDNPTSRATLADGARVVFVEDNEDGPRAGQPNQAEQRTFTFAVGVINRTAAARAACDADMVACKNVISAHGPVACRTLKDAGALTVFSAVRESRRIYKIEGIDVGGALILTQFDIDYTVPNTTIRGRA